MPDRTPPVILFDFGGTLDADGVPWADRFFDAYRRSGGAVDVSRFGALFRKSDEMLLGSHPVGGIGFHAMVHHQAAILANLLPDGARFAEPMADGFHRSALAVVRKNRPVLARLALERRLGVVSNFTGNLRECLDELELSSLFSVVVDSSVVGAAKPDPTVFVRALEAIRVPAASAWFVGDNPENDVRPASKLGMTTCWLAPADRETPPGLRPTHRIASLLELEGLVT